MPFQKNLLTKIEPKVYRPVGLQPVMKEYTSKAIAKAQITRPAEKPLAKSRTELGKGLRKNLNTQNLVEHNKRRAALRKAASVEKVAFPNPFAAYFKYRAMKQAFPIIGEVGSYLGGKALNLTGKAAWGATKGVAKGAYNGAKYVLQNPGKVLKNTAKAVGVTGAAVGAGAVGAMGYGAYKGVKHVVWPAAKFGVNLVTGTVGTAIDAGKAVVKAPFAMLSGANKVRDSISAVKNMSPAGKAALGAGTALTAYMANDHAQKYREQKAQEEAMGNQYSGQLTEDQYVGKMASATKPSMTSEAQSKMANVDRPNIPADTSKPNSNNPEDYPDMYDYQEYVNTEGHPDRENLPNHIEDDKSPRKIAQVIGADIAVISEINEYTGHPRMKVASMSYREKVAAAKGSKLLGASLTIGATGIGVAQLNKREGEFKVWKPNYYVQ